MQNHLSGGQASRAISGGRRKPSVASRLPRRACSAVLSYTRGQASADRQPPRRTGARSSCFVGERVSIRTRRHPSTGSVGRCRPHRAREDRRQARQGRGSKADGRTGLLRAAFALAASTCQAMTSLRPPFFAKHAQPEWWYVLVRPSHWLRRPGVLGGLREPSGLAAKPLSGAQRTGRAGCCATVSGGGRTMARHSCDATASLPSCVRPQCRGPNRGALAADILASRPLIGCAAVHESAAPPSYFGRVKFYVGSASRAAR